MPNAVRGETGLVAGDARYTLSFSVNSMCELEEALGAPVAKIAEGLDDPASVRMSTIRTLIWAALRDHHPEVSLSEAGDIATVAGMQSTMDAIGKAFAGFFPPEEEQKKPNPRRAARA